TDPFTSIRFARWAAVARPSARKLARKWRTSSGAPVGRNDHSCAVRYPMVLGWQSEISLNLSRDERRGLASHTGPGNRYRAAFAFCGGLTCRAVVVCRVRQKGRRTLIMQ